RGRLDRDCRGLLRRVFLLCDLTEPRESVLSCDSWASAARACRRLRAKTRVVALALSAKA
ncbi:MAG: hypothetical protein PHU21_06690, partial [Elusimicrobia bacterium]|nr:hypothetical protein [Elusimicrobiota bacterium]